MNKKFYRKVADYMPVPLPKPTMKQNKPLLDEDGNEKYTYGIQSKLIEKSGFVGSIEYAFIETKNIILSMGTTLKYLFTGNLGINDLSILI